MRKRQRLKGIFLTMTLAAMLAALPAAASAAQVTNLRTSHGAAHDRIVVDLSEDADYELERGDGVVTLEVNDSSPRGLKQTSFHSSRVKGVRWSTKNGKVFVRIELAKSGLAAKVGKLRSPSRIYVDIQPASAGNAEGSRKGTAGKPAAAGTAAKLNLPAGTEVSDLAPGLRAYAYHDTSDGELRAYFIDADPARYRPQIALGGGEIPGVETLSGISDRTQAVAAINASFFDWTGWLEGVTKIDGNVVGTMYIPRSAFGLTADGKPVFGTVTYNGTVTLGGVTLPVAGVDVPRSSEGLILYNRFYGGKTPRGGRDYVVERGRVTALGWGGTPIPHDGVVVSVKGDAKVAMNDVSVGDVASIVQDLGSPWNTCPLVLSVGPRLVQNGAVNVTTAAEQLGDIDTSRAPRSAIAVTRNGHYLLAVVDGRQAISHGATLREWAALLVKFGAYQALNLDGGGSSEIIAGGRVLNSPSDGNERSIGAALILLPR